MNLYKIESNSRIMKCNSCTGIEYCFEGYTGKNAKYLFVLNHADIRVKKNESQKRYLEILRSTPSGKILEMVIQRANLDFDDVYITNIFKGIMPMDIPKNDQLTLDGFEEPCPYSGVELSVKDPSTQEYRNCLSVFEKQVKELNPEKIVLFGRQPSIYVLKNEGSLEKISLKESTYQDIPTLPSFHPSKISKFMNKKKIREYIGPIADFLKK